MKIAIIPARLNSKRIAKKNIKTFHGKPIIAWTIENLIKSKIFSKVIVSTESKKISNIVKFYGAEVPFMRPKKLADDFTTTIDVIKNITYELQGININPDYICCVYPCAVFLDINDLKKSLKISSKYKSKFVYPVARYNHPINRALKMNKNNFLEFIDKKIDENKRTQDFVNTYHDAGQFYWGSKKAWLKNKSIHSNAIGYEIPNYRVVDIDNKNDWIRAELLFKKLN